MPTEPRRVLVPAAGARVVDRLLSPGSMVYTYEYEPRTLSTRILRKAGVLSSAQQLDRMLRTADAVPWDRVDALWLGADVQLSDGEASALLERMPSLRIAYWQRTGLDGLPTGVLESRGIRVVGAPDLSSRWVAETAIACILSDAKFLTLSARDRTPSLQHFTRPLAQLRITVLGTGHIGCTVAQMASGLGMHVVGLTRDPERVDPRRSAFAMLHRFPDALVATARETDYLVLALPATEGTRQVIDHTVLEALGPSGVLVNLARPGLVDETALLRALDRGTLHAAYVSRLERVAARLPRRVSLPANLFLTRNREAHVAEKTARAAQQFAELL